MKGNLNNLQIAAINLEMDDNIIDNLKRPIKNRNKFSFDSYAITIPRYFYRFIGSREDEDEYFDNLLRLDRELSNFGSLYLRFSEGLDRNISIKIQSTIDNVWIHIKSLSDINTFELIKAIEDNKLFPKFKDYSVLEQVKNYLKILMDYYLNSYKDIELDKFKYILNHIVYWINFYLPALLYSFDYEDINPKVIFYGEISEEETLFLIILGALGCDVLYFNPKEDKVFNKVDRFNSFSKEIKFTKSIEIKPFPSSITDRIQTTAYSAKEELNKTLFSEDANFYRPWQFEEYYITAQTLKTTYEEIFIWQKEKTYIRDGWKVENNRVFIPNLFSKIKGTHEELNKYWKLIDEVLKEKDVLFYNKLPIIDYTHLEYSKFNEIYNKDLDKFNLNKLINASWWKYKDLRTGLQKNMAEKITQLCINPTVINKSNENFRDFQVEIFSVLINLKDDLLKLLQVYDYAEEVPKIVIYNNEKNGELSFEDCIMLGFMNYMGIDIFVFNPTGYNDIENYIYEDLYDTHTLEEMKFNLDFQEYKGKDEKKGFFKKLFNL